MSNSESEEPCSFPHVSDYKAYRSRLNLTSVTCQYGNPGAGALTSGPWNSYL